MTVEADAKPNEASVQVGTTIRRIRNDRGLSLREVAAQSGLSTGFLSLVERGVNSPSLTSLFAVAETLGVTAAELIGEAAPKPAPQFSVTHANAADTPVVSLGDRTYRVLSGTLPGQGLEALKTTIRPMSQASAMSSHDGEEFCYVLDGELTFLFSPSGDLESAERVVVGAGDSIHFLSSSTHAIHNASNRPVEALWIVDRPLIAPPGAVR